MTTEAFFTKLFVTTPARGYLLAASLTALTVGYALWPSGPSSAYTVVETATMWLGVDSSEPVAAVEGWLQDDPTRADGITDTAVVVAGFAAAIGIAPVRAATRAFLAATFLLFSSLAIAAGGAVPWESIAWLLVTLAGVAACLVHVENARIGEFLIDVILVLLYPVAFVLGPLIPDGSNTPPPAAPTLP